MSGTNFRAKFFLFLFLFLLRKKERQRQTPHSSVREKEREILLVFESEKVGMNELQKKDGEFLKLTLMSD